jgi:hypothetical protein
MRCDSIRGVRAAIRAFGAVAAVVGIMVGAQGGDEPAYPLSRLGVRTAPLVLLSRADVRADVQLSREQTDSAERMLKELQGKAAALKGKSGPQVVAARREIDEAQERWLETNLTPDQRNRLTQIDLQWEGAAALVSRPVLADALGLTNVQRAEIGKVMTEHKNQRHESEREAARALAERTLNVLTAEQKEHWKEMLGRPFVPQQAEAKESAGAKR